MRYEIRARSLTEILDGGFQLYRNHFGSFIGVTAVISLSSSLITSLIWWETLGTTAIPAKPVAGSLGRFFFAIALTMLCTFVAYVLQQATLTIAISDAYLGRPVSPMSAFRRTLAILGPLMGAGLISGIGIAVGLILLIVPGFLLILRWIFSVQAIAIEGYGASASLSRSAALTAGRRNKIAVLVSLLGIIQFAISLGGQALIPHSLQSIPILGALLLQVPVIFITPVYPGVITLAYFDARVRSEGFDLEVLSRATSIPPAAMSSK